MSELTELGLKRPLARESEPAPVEPAPPGRVSAPTPVRPGSAAPAAPSARAVEPFVDRQPEGFAMFLDRLMEVLEQLAPESDVGELDAFRSRIREYRLVINDPRRRGEMPEVTDACIGLCRSYLEGARLYHAEREKELAELISILRDAAKLSVGDSTEFHAQVLASSDRFVKISELENIRELRRRIGDEVGNLRCVVAEKQQKDEQAYAQLTRRVETLQKKLAEMEVESTLDPLTKVGNRRRFQTALTRLVTNVHESGGQLSLAMIDVDHFKQINDTHGHPIGDRVLLAVAQCIANGVRVSDVVARYGGEEFAVLLPNAAAGEVEARFKQLLLDIAASSYEYDALGRTEKVRFTVSCGIVEIEPGENEDALVKRADEALYEAKKKGRNRVIARKKSLLGRVLAWG